MFTNIGSKIKLLAKITGLVGVICGAIYGAVELFGLAAANGHLAWLIPMAAVALALFLVHYFVPAFRAVFDSIRNLVGILSLVVIGLSAANLILHLITACARPEISWHFWYLDLVLLVLGLILNRVEGVSRTVDLETDYAVVVPIVALVLHVIILCFADGSVLTPILVTAGVLLGSCVLAYSLFGFAEILENQTRIQENEAEIKKHLTGLQR